jgi:hypothetical protein
MQTSLDATQFYSIVDQELAELLSKVEQFRKVRDKFKKTEPIFDAFMQKVGAKEMHVYNALVRQTDDNKPLLIIKAGFHFTTPFKNRGTSLRKAETDLNNAAWELNKDDVSFSSFSINKYNLFWAGVTIRIK